MGQALKGDLIMSRIGARGQPLALILRHERRSMVMAASRPYVGYDFMVGTKIVHSGITNDPDRRETEHKQRWTNGHLKVVTGPMTPDGARDWESKKQKAITPKRS